MARRRRARIAVGLLAFPVALAAVPVPPPEASPHVSAAILTFQVRDDERNPLSAFAVGARGRPLQRQQIVRRGTYAHDVATNPAGAAVVAFVSHVDDRFTVRATIRLPGERFGRSALLERRFALEARAAIDRRGDALVAWARSRDGGDHATIMTSVRRAGGRFSRPARLPGQRDDRDLRIGGVALDDAGRATVVWSRGGRTLISTRPARGKFGSPLALSTPASDAGPPLFAQNAAGMAVVARVLRATDSEPSRLEFQERSDGRWSRARTIRAARTRDFLDVQAVAVGPTGAAIVAWTLSRVDPGLGYHRVALRVMRRPAGGAFGPPATVARYPDRSHSDGASVVRAAIDARGDAALAWNRGDYAILAAYARAGARFGAPLTLLRPNRALELSSRDPRLRFTAAGSAAAVWESNDLVAARLVQQPFGAAGAGRRTILAQAAGTTRVGPPSTCHPAGADIVRSNAVATIFALPDGQTFGCALAVGEPRLLPGANPMADAAFALRNTEVAFAQYGCDGRRCQSVVAHDLRDFSSRRTTVFGLYGLVAALRVRRLGDVAWINCHSDRQTVGGCAPGYYGVWIGEDAENSRRIAFGPDVVPASLRLTRRAVSWVQGGRRRSMRFVSNP